MLSTSPDLISTERNKQTILISQEFVSLLSNQAFSKTKPLVRPNFSLLNGRIDYKNQFLKLRCDSNGAVKFSLGNCYKNFEEKDHRSKMTSKSHHVKGTCYQYDLFLLMCTFITWVS